jgi:diguanylate cyclase (GGDEF)-like protein/PAS domain S-box-containing protein
MEKDLKVLLVDDDEDEYILIKGLFTRLPGQGNGFRYTLDWVSSYEQALDVCASQDYDVHLVDYYLGGYNGLDLMRAAEALGCDGPFILLTGQGSYDLDLEAMQQGVADYLLKDQINESLLERSIRYALERKEIQEALERRVQERTRELAEANQELHSEIERRRQAEETLRESEARFRTLAETTSAAIFIVQDHKIRYANPATRFVTGYDPEELVGKDLWKLAHPAYQEPLRQSRLVSEWARGIPARYEIKIIDRGGDERWVDVTAGNMLYEGSPARLFTAFDITERDMAERALRRAKEELEQRVVERTAQIQATNLRLQTVLRTLPVALVIADGEGRIVESNPAFQELWDSREPLPQEIAAWSAFEGWWSENGEPLRPGEWPLARAVQAGETTLGQLIDIRTLSGRPKTIIHSAVPILDADGQVSGGVAVAQDISHQRQLEQQAQQAAQTARLRADELDGLHRATAALLSTLEFDDLLCQILDAAQSAIPAADKGILHLVSPGTGELQVRATLGFSSERIRILRSPAGPTFPARVTRERRPQLIDDIEQAGLAQDDAEELRGLRSMIIAPLTYGEQVLGALSLSAGRPGVFSEANLRLLVTFAATTTAALQNALLHAEIKQLAISDPLTGKYNRRAFFDLGRREIERFQRFNHPLAAIMIDLDNLKHINDTYGHSGGDAILRGLAERCRLNIRETDIFGRYGGDEFALLLPDTDRIAAVQIAERIRETIDSAPWPTDQGLAPVSVSLGVAAATKSHHSLENLLADADRALYQAKAGGRNRVEVG